MKKLLLLLLLFPMFAQAEFELCQSRACVVPLGALYYDPGNSGMLQSALIADTTSTVASWTCTLYKGIGAAGTAVTFATTAITLSASGGSNDCWRAGQGTSPTWFMELTATNTNTVGGLLIECYYSGRLILQREYKVIPAPNYAAWYESTNGFGGMIASVSMETNTQATRILSGVGNWGKSATDTIVSAHQITDGLIQQVTPYVVAGGRIIPSTGCTYPEFYRVMDGHMGRYLMLRSISLSDATPEMKLAVREDTPGQSTPALEDALTYMSFASHYQVDGVTPTEHVWYWDISNLARERWYSFVCSIRKEGKWISGVGALIMNPTPELTLSETPLSETLFNSTMGEFISDVSQAFRDAGKGFSDIVVFRGQGNVDRSIPGVSSEASRSFASGEIYAITKCYHDYFSDVDVYYEWLNDQDAIYGKTSKWKEATVPVKVRAASENVTLTAAGEE